MRFLSGCIKPFPCCCDFSHSDLLLFIIIIQSGKVGEDEKMSGTETRKKSADADTMRAEGGCDATQWKFFICNWSDNLLDYDEIRSLWALNYPTRCFLCGGPLMKRRHELSHCMTASQLHFDAFYNYQFISYQSRWKLYLMTGRALVSTRIKQKVLAGQKNSFLEHSSIFSLKVNTFIKQTTQFTVRLSWRQEKYIAYTQELKLCIKTNINVFIV